MDEVIACLRILGRRLETLKNAIEGCSVDDMEIEFDRVNRAFTKAVAVAREQAGVNE